MIKRTWKSISKIKLFLSLPSVWLALLILALALASIFISKVLYTRGRQFESSVFSNIFAGLSTGFIITILSNAKSIYILYLQSKLKWFQQLKELNQTHFSKMIELRKAFAHKEANFFEIAYDAAASANHVNERILQSTYGKVKWFEPRKYFMKRFNYDSLQEAQFFENLHDDLYEFGEDSSRDYEILKKVEEVSKKISAISTFVFIEITTLEVKIGSAQKSII